MFDRFFGNVYFFVKFSYNRTVGIKCLLLLIKEDNTQFWRLGETLQLYHCSGENIKLTNIYIYIYIERERERDVGMDLPKFWSLFIPTSLKSSNITRDGSRLCMDQNKKQNVQIHSHKHGLSNNNSTLKEMYRSWGKFRKWEKTETFFSWREKLGNNKRCIWRLTESTR